MEVHVVLVSILLIRGMWSAETYLQERRNLRKNELDGPVYGLARSLQLDFSFLELQMYLYL